MFNRKAQVVFVSSVFALALSACQQQPMSAVAPQLMPRAVSFQAQSARAIYHVVPAGEQGWQVKASRNPVALSTHRTKAEAIVAGRALAQSHELGQLIIHRANGTFEKEYTYGKDPRDIKG